MEKRQKEQIESRETETAKKEREREEAGGDSRGERATDNNKKFHVSDQ